MPGRRHSSDAPAFARHEPAGAGEAVRQTRQRGSRALYQSIRLWLVEHSSALFTDDDTDATHLTPHSARRGYAAQGQAEGYDDLDVQDALRHERLGTTLEYLEDAAAGAAARRLLGALAEERRGTGS